MVFAHEGNNIPESIQLVSYLNEWKKYLVQVIEIIFLMHYYKLTNLDYSLI